MADRPPVDFVIAGSMRSGSTSLNRYLKDHPDVQMAAKEPRYFAQNFERGEAWYRGLFDDDARMRGECSPSYLPNHTALQRMVEALPHGRFIVILRDPVDRIWSHYQLEASRGREDRSFESYTDALLGQRDSANGFWHSRYSIHLPVLFDLAGVERCLVVPFDELSLRPKTTYRYVCRFLGLDDTTVPDVVGRRVNAAFKARSRRVRQLGKHPLMPKRVRNLIGHLNHREVQAPEMPTSQRRMLDDAFQVDRVAALDAVRQTYLQLRLE